MKPYFTDSTGGITIYHGDCREIMPSMPQVGLIATDPPYHKVVDADWDCQWQSVSEFLAWIDDRSAEWHAALKPNGSVYCFAYPDLAGRIETTISRRFNVLNHIVWHKHATRADKARKEDLRSFFPDSERIIFAEHYGADNIAKGEAGYVAKCDDARGMIFEPIRAYLDSERERAGFTRQQCNEVCGNQMAGHYFSTVQWALPTAENYAKLQDAFNGHGGGEFLRKDYEFLRKDYEGLRKDYEGLRRPFFLTDGVQYGDVWRFATPRGAERCAHPCGKPLALMQHIVAASTTPDTLVLDPFMGSGTTLVAAKLEGRRAIGVEIEERYCEIAASRLAQEVLPFERIERPNLKQVEIP